MNILFESGCHGDCQQGRRCDCAGHESNAVRGLLNGLLLAVPFWLVVALIAWAVS